ncbi:Uncharacterised protein [uncultured archaeon]|nr:Uncharacterised protein [uncultured archaeon]
MDITERIILGSDIIKPEETELIMFLNSKGKYFRVSDPDGLRRLSKRFGLPEKDIQAALRASGFDFVLKIPIKAYWMRKEVLPERGEDK